MDHVVMSPIIATMTELLRDPKAVLDALPDRDVLLRRQGTADVLLVDAIRESTVRDTLAMVLDALAAGLAAVGARSSLADTLPTHLPWTKSLLPNDRLEFLDDLVATARGGCDLDDFGPTGRVLRDWKMTARILASEAMNAAASDSVTDNSGDEVSQALHPPRRVPVAARKATEVS